MVGNPIFHFHAPFNIENEVLKFIRERGNKSDVKKFIEGWKKIKKVFIIGSQVSLKAITLANMIIYQTSQIKCDKYASEELERSNREFKKYYASVRNRDLPPKYYELRDRIVDLLYPEFLRKQHKCNPKLKEYVDSLHAITH